MNPFWLWAKIFHGLPFWKGCKKDYLDLAAELRPISIGSKVLIQ